MWRDKDFLIPFFQIVIPVAAQNFVWATLSIVDNMVVGQLGTAAIAAIGLANQLYFLLNYWLFGVHSSTALFTAQFWGRGDVPSIRKVLGLSLVVGLAGALVFTIIAVVFPQQTLRFYTTDEEVIRLGSGYLRLVGLSFLITPVTHCYAASLRSVRLVHLPMAVSMATVVLNTFLNYTLIFGLFGLPAMGVQGAGLALVCSRLLECLVLLLFIYSGRTPAAASPRELLGFDARFAWFYARTALPVVFNEFLWAIGTSFYARIYAHIGTESVAAYSIAATFQNMAIVFFVGIYSACGVMVGNKIGAGDHHTAYIYARRSLYISAGAAVLVGALMLVVKDPLLSFYRVSDFTRLSASGVIMVMSFGLWIKALCMTFVVGILRSGGDTSFTMLVDAGSVWAFGLPAASLAAYVLGLPVAGVYAFSLLEGVMKIILSAWRFRSRKWFHTLA
jgi:putative MATE family efflux protein